MDHITINAKPIEHCWHFDSWCKCWPKSLPP